MAKHTSQRLFVLAHSFGYALFLGASLAVTLLVHAAASGGVEHLGFALGVASRLQHWVIMPGGALVLVSGVLLSTVGRWGFIKHRWMIAKLVGSVILFIHSQLSFRPLTDLLWRNVQIAGPIDALPPDFLDLYPHFLRVGAIQVVVALALAALGIVKPGGRTRLAKPAAREDGVSVPS